MPVVSIEGIITLCCIAVGIATVRWRGNPESFRDQRKRKADERQRDEKETAYHLQRFGTPEVALYAVNRESNFVELSV